MTYYGGKELAESFRTVRKNTLIVAEDIPEEQYGFRPTPEVRSVSEMLSHLAVLTTQSYEMHGVKRLTTLEGVDFGAFMQKLREDAERLRTKAQILDALRKEGEKWAGWLDGLSDDFLGEQVRMPPEIIPTSKSRLEMLLSVKEHEMHHRAQLMLIQRLLGIVPHLTCQREGAQPARAQAS